MKCKKCGFPVNPGSSFCLNCGEKQLPPSYDMISYDKENVETMFKNLGLSTEDYLIMKVQKTTFMYPVTDAMVNFDGQLCAVNFSSYSLVFFIFSKLDMKKITHIFEIPIEELEDFKLSGNLFSHKFYFKNYSGTINFKVPNKIIGFPLQRPKIKKFKKMYSKKK